MYEQCSAVQCEQMIEKRHRADNMDLKNVTPTKLVNEMVGGLTIER